MVMIRKDLVENKDTVTMLLIPVAILAKLIEHILLPDKYFYDSSRMLQQSLGILKVSEGGWGGSYEFTAQLFANLNIFNFTTLLQWSILIGLVFDVIMLVIFIRIKEMNMLQSVFALMCVGLINIYVFNIGKDIIQFALFAMCFVIISINRVPTWLKVMGCALIFYWESTFFRNYYIMIAAFVIGVYLILSFIRRRKMKLNLPKVLIIVAILYFMMFVFLLIASIFMPEDYSEILHCKDSSTQLGATTTIDDRIDYGDNLILYMENYFINSLRMVFPYELLQSGIFYAPFFIFQVLLLYYIYRNIRKIHIIDGKNVLALSVYIAFFMGSVLFEPDFGSWARHEAASFPMIILFAIDNLNILEIDIEQENQEKRIKIYE